MSSVLQTPEVIVSARTKQRSPQSFSRLSWWKPRCAAAKRNWAARGSLVAETGKRTGRSPKDKFTIKDSITENKVEWGSANLPFSPDKFDALYERVIDYLAGQRAVRAGSLLRRRSAVPACPFKSSTNTPGTTFSSGSFLFVPPRKSSRRINRSSPSSSAPGFMADPKRDGTNSEVFIMVNFTKKLVLIGGTQYAGEMKKSIFGIMNFLLPERNVFPMHCSANIGQDGVTALFFGLSGTGKTTLSADPKRRLIGDDEHGWSADRRL